MATQFILILMHRAIVTRYKNEKCFGSLDSRRLPFESTGPRYASRPVVQIAALASVAGRNIAGNFHFARQEPGHASGAFSFPDPRFAV